MIIYAKELRKPENLARVPGDKPGYYKWWADRKSLDIILNALDIEFATIEPFLEERGGLYCVYVGIAVKESIQKRLDWHINQHHSNSHVKSGTLSTLRQSISSIVAHNQHDEEAANAFIDKLTVEFFPLELTIKSTEAKEAIHAIERRLLSEHLHLLNIQENKHPNAKSIKQKLKKLRKESK